MPLEEGQIEALKALEGASILEIDPSKRYLIVVDNCAANMRTLEQLTVFSPDSQVMAVDGNPRETVAVFPLGDSKYAVRT